MSEELRSRIQLARERKEKERIEDTLPKQMFEGFVSASEIPDWVAKEFARFTRTSTQPDYSISTESRHELGAWIESLTRDLEFSDVILVRTGLEYFPWLQFRCTPSGWAELLMQAVGRDVALLSQDKQNVLVIFEEEYEYIAFATKYDESPDR
jgi:hypothetical protein